MKSLNYFLKESSGDILKPKRNKWIKFNPNELSNSEKEELSKEFIDLIQTAYAPIGGHVKFTTADDVFKDNKITHWKVIDLHGSPDADVIVFGKESKYGIKSVGVGHDGERDSTRVYLDAKAKDLSKPGYYVEVSGKLAEIMLGKYKVPSVDSEEVIKKVLKKDIKWHGEHPDGKTPGDGWYTRKIGNSDHTKILLGKPKGI